MKDDTQVLPERTASDPRGLQTAELSKASTPDNLHPVAEAEAINGAGR